MFGEMAIEAIDRQVQFAVGIPMDVEVCLVERPITRFRREFVPGQPLRLVEPEAVGIGFGEVAKLGDLDRANAGVEAIGNGMDGFAQSALSCSARLSTRCAGTRWGRSTILPPTDRTPASGCASNAATMASACFTSASDGVK